MIRMLNDIAPEMPHDRVVRVPSAAHEAHRADGSRQGSRPAIIAICWALCVAWLFAACDDATRRPVGDSCTQSSECRDGPCGGGRCLDPDADDDLDGLTNKFEAAIGSDPVVADTDGDGIRDRQELGPTLELLDTDGDGLLDIIESAIHDADDDCITDQYDVRNDLPDADVAPMVAAVCSHEGLCGTQRDRLRAVCPDGRSAECDYGAIEGRVAVEDSCNGVDENCDGRADEGWCPDGMTALVLPETISLPIGGVRRVEPRARLRDASEAALGDEDVVWTSIGDGLVLENDADIRAHRLARARIVGRFEVTARLGVFETRTFIDVVPPSCSDGVENGDEFGVDCGGPCAPCATDPCAGFACAANAHCELQDRQRLCVCDSGYAANGDGVCVDVDECDAESTPCGKWEECRNLPGRFECKCLDGYARGQAGACEDIDECAAAPSSCGLGERCVNRQGGFDCPCAPGFEADADGVCQALPCWIDGMSVVDPGCLPATPRCDVANGRVCVTCLDDGHCANHAAGSRCDVARGACVACLGHGDCDAAEACVAQVCERCDVDPGRSVDPGCDVATPVCIATDEGRDCHECAGDNDCAANADTPRCAPTTLTCVECLAHEDCALDAGEICDVSQGLCVTPPAFATRWDSAIAGPTTSAVGTIRLPLVAGGTYDFVVDWGDGSQSVIRDGQHDAAVHTYAIPGEYAVTMRGVITGWRFAGGGDAVRLMSIGSWGWLRLGATDRQFDGAANMVVTARENLDLTGTTSLRGAFRNCAALTRLPGVERWDTRAIVDLGEAFAGAVSFDWPLGSWDTAAVTALDGTFEGARMFNRPLNTWNVGSVTTLAGTFAGASSFDQPLDGWNTERVTSFQSTFDGASVFDRDLSGWSLASATNLDGMLRGVTLSPDHYDTLLNAWAARSGVLPTGMVFDGGASRHTWRGFRARESLLADVGDGGLAWTIADGGLCPECLVCLAEPDEVRDLGCDGVLRRCNALEAPRCVRCLSHGDCTGDSFGELCDVGAERCVACLEDGDCPFAAYGDTCNVVVGQCSRGREFVSTWDSRIATDSTGESAVGSLALPLHDGGDYDFIVDWGDGTSDIVTRWDSAGARHTFAVPGLHTVRIRGRIVGWRFAMAGDRNRLVEISAWGTLRLGNLERYFAGATNLRVTATDILDLTGTFTLTEAFRECAALTDVPGIGSWDTSRVTTLRAAFFRAPLFNGDVGGWDTSKVTSMMQTFDGARAFNADIGGWDTSAVTRFTGMFNDAQVFNQDISNWNTSSATDMGTMFRIARRFNQEIGGWDTSKVTTMTRMFEFADDFNGDVSTWDTSRLVDASNLFQSALSFNQPIGVWNTANVTNMASMLRGTRFFNHPVGDWNVGNVTRMDGMFLLALSFNQPVDGWDVSKVTNMEWMFRGAAAFNQPLEAWGSRVGRVETMADMFMDAMTFNQPIGNWDVSSVRNMSRMFHGALTFNQPLAAWQTSAVTTMHEMFRSAEDFNQEIGGWDVSNVTDMSGMFLYAVAFGGQLDNWNVTRVTTMARMFESTLAFNSNLDTWDVSGVVDMGSMFRNARGFNRDIGMWDTSNVTSMAAMFEDAVGFRGDISGWDVGAVTSMAAMFRRAYQFTGDLSGWNVAQVGDMAGMFEQHGMSTARYDAVLNAWSQLPDLQPDVVFDGGSSRFSAAGAAARAYLEQTWGWTIIDGGLAP